jgi:hypothetical protein
MRSNKGPDQCRLPAEVREVQHLSSVGALDHDCIADIVVPMGYCTPVSPTMNFHAVTPGTPGLARVRPGKKARPGRPGRVHPTPRHTAAIAAFSVALGRIAADVLAGSGR